MAPPWKQVTKEVRSAPSWGEPHHTPTGIVAKKGDHRQEEGWRCNRCGKENYKTRKCMVCDKSYYNNYGDGWETRRNCTNNHNWNIDPFPVGHQKRKVATAPRGGRGPEKKKRSREKKKK